MAAHPPVREDLLDRVRTPRLLAHVSLRWPRFLLAALLAGLPALAVLLVALLGPPEFGKALTTTRNVHDVFARFLTAVATAGAIAVSVATLAMRRELRGIDSHEERRETNDAFRERVRERLGAETMPVGPGDFLADMLHGIAERAARLRREAGADELRAEAMGVTLDDHLRALEERMGRTARRVEEVRGRPDRMLLVILDQENELSRSVVRRFKRHPALSEGMRRELERFDELLGDYVVMSKFVKMLDTQWGLSRMSLTILVSGLPAILVSALMVLTYGEGAVDALGRGGAAALVCGALAVATFPLAAFVSHLLRFIFINQHTLPTDGFVLGPEETEVVERRIGT